MSKQRNRACYLSADGESSTRLYRIWAGMLSRCNNPNRKKYPRYGGRGIRVEFKSYFHFRDWALQNGYEDSLTIERINNDGNYSEFNCTWIPAVDQSKNTSCIKFSEEVKQSILQDVISEVSFGAKKRIAKKYNMKYDTLLHLLVKYRKEGKL